MHNVYLDSDRDRQVGWRVHGDSQPPRGDTCRHRCDHRRRRPETGRCCPTDSGSADSEEEQADRRYTTYRPSMSHRHMMLHPHARHNNIVIFTEMGSRNVGLTDSGGATPGRAG